MTSEAVPESQLALEVLQQFRMIYGTMRRHFREVEERCGLTGSQMWVLQEAQHTPGLGVNELASRMGIHQSTCSQIVEKLVAVECLTKKHPHEDKRRVGLYLADAGSKAIAALPGPAEGLLPQALASTPAVVLRTLNINLSELIRHLPKKDDSYANTPLADMVRGRDHT